MTKGGPAKSWSTDCGRRDGCSLGSRLLQGRWSPEAPNMHRQQSAAGQKIAGDSGKQWQAVGQSANTGGGQDRRERRPCVVGSGRLAETRSREQLKSHVTRNRRSDCPEDPNPRAPRARLLRGADAAARAGDGNPREGVGVHQRQPQSPTRLLTRSRTTSGSRRSRGGCLRCWMPPAVAVGAGGGAGGMWGSPQMTCCSRRGCRRS